jgi:hypothetical protein
LSNVNALNPNANGTGKQMIPGDTSVIGQGTVTYGNQPHPTSPIDLARLEPWAAPPLP